ncbi:hypothetical protein DPMN_168450 [Dreissena polymorpha]|uniref:Uncharacterized protein n=1 Tax=Dreissena polymorpha TaxID=45954 RepID=A0A9D4F1Z3_DREPO|nr:hypothetical protein DPMN_168450 [Dreissena polymorpha]
MGSSAIDMTSNRRSLAQLHLKPQTSQGLQNKGCLDTRTYLPFLTTTKFWHSANGYRLSLSKLAARNKKTVLIRMDTMAYVV